MLPADLRLETLAVHSGMEGLRESGAHVPPIDLSTTNPLPGVELGGESYEELAGGGGLLPGNSAVYQRLWQPGVARFEDGLAALEGADGAVAFSTGMAALTAVLLASVTAGKPHIVALRPIYGGTDHVLDSRLLGTSVTWCDADSVAASLRPDTGLVIIESPANPTLELMDIARVVAAAGDVPVLVDNTFATPVLQRPAHHGVVLVLHSATKYLGGHGDVIGGVVATTSEWAERLRRVRAITGGLLHPWGAYLLHRGLQTLPVRVLAQQEGATKLAEAVRAHPAVDRVYFPGLPESDPRGLVGRQMSGPGSMLSFSMSGGYAAAATVAGGVRLITHAVSLGGVDSLIQHPASLTHRPVAPHARPDAGLLRLSVGLESPEDLWADLKQALDALS